MLKLYQNDPLYSAIMANDNEAAAGLKKKGEVLSEHIRYMLTHPVGSLAVSNDYSYAWFGHIEAIQKMNDKKLISVLRNLSFELGEPMYCSGSYNWEWSTKLYNPEMFSCVLDCFDCRKMSKKWVWKKILDMDMPELAAIAAEHGWLKMPKKRDELIKYASDNGKTECLAWLLDFKNRRCNLAEEREKAEKRIMRELNANPDSVTEMKKLWGFQTREDGTIIITSCKKAAGGKREISVPEKIGGKTVAAIGAYAFSPFASRISAEGKNFRREISRITLPETIRIIEENAFAYCEGLEGVNIPGGIEKISQRVFSSCTSLKKITLPDSVRVIENSAFSYCKKLEEINIPDGVEEIADGTFSGCLSLKEIHLPDSVRILGAYSFRYCKALEKINIPQGIVLIENYAFSECMSLKYISLPSGVKTIKRNAFENCRNLKTAVLSEGLEEIGYCVFMHCKELEKLCLPVSVRKISNLSAKSIYAGNRLSAAAASDCVIKKEPPVTPFNNCPRLTITVYKGSYAEKYCKRNNVPYVVEEK